MIGVLAELERMKFGRKMKLTPVQTVKARKLIVALSRSRCGLLNLTSAKILATHRTFCPRF
jgi:hypothetical protein